MVEGIKGPENLQSSLLYKGAQTTKSEEVDREIKVDYKLSLKKELVETLTYNRTGKVESNNLDDTNSLRGLVAKLLERQGMTWEAAMAGETVEIDPETRAEAQALVADDGYWGVEQTSDRIFQFAVANAGGDLDKLDQIKKAVEKGFNMAKDTLGGALPEISTKTYEAVMEKLDSWAGNESDSFI